MPNLVEQMNANNPGVLSGYVANPTGGITGQEVAAANRPTINPGETPDYGRPNANALTPEQRDQLGGVFGAGLNSGATNVASGAPPSASPIGSPTPIRDLLTGQITGYDTFTNTQNNLNHAPDIPGSSGNVGQNVGPMIYQNGVLSPPTINPNSAAGIAAQITSRGGTVDPYLAAISGREGYQPPAANIGAFAAARQTVTPPALDNTPTFLFPGAMGMGPTVTTYMPVGSFNQVAVPESKDTLGYNTGELAVYQAEYYNGQLMGFGLIGGGGRNALQSGQFTINAPEISSPANLYQQWNLKDFTPATFNDITKYSRLGAEAYGGIAGTPLDNRTLTPTSAFSVYPNNPNNLANYVNPEGVNIPKAQNPGASIPWAVAPASPAISYFPGQGAPVVPGASQAGAAPLVPGAEESQLPKPFISTAQSPGFITTTWDWLQSTAPKGDQSNPFGAAPPQPVNVMGWIKGAATQAGDWFRGAESNPISKVVGVAGTTGYAYATVPTASELGMPSAMDTSFLVATPATPFIVGALIGGTAVFGLESTGRLGFFGPTKETSVRSIGGDVADNLYRAGASYGAAWNQRLMGETPSIRTSEIGSYSYNGNEIRPVIGPMTELPKPYISSGEIIPAKLPSEITPREMVGSEIGFPKENPFETPSQTPYRNPNQNPNRNIYGYPTGTPNPNTLENPNQNPNANPNSNPFNPVNPTVPTFTTITPNPAVITYPFNTVNPNVPSPPKPEDLKLNLPNIPSFNNYPGAAGYGSRRRSRAFTEFFPVGLDIATFGTGHISRMPKKRISIKTPKMPKQPKMNIKKRKR